VPIILLICILSISGDVKALRDKPANYLRTRGKLSLYSFEGVLGRAVTVKLIKIPAQPPILHFLQRL
jgi:hypothetical protein